MGGEWKSGKNTYPVIFIPKIHIISILLSLHKLGWSEETFLTDVKLRENVLKIPI